MYGVARSAFGGLRLRPAGLVLSSRLVGAPTANSSVSLRAGGRRLLSSSAPKAAGEAGGEAVKAAATQAAGATAATGTAAAAAGGFSYVAFAKTYPVSNNLIIATLKTGAAGLGTVVALTRT